VLERARKEIRFFLHDDDTLYQASSLSFFTLFSLVPTLMIVLGVLATLPGFENLVAQIKAFLYANLFPTHYQVVERTIDAFFANAFQTGILGAFYVTVTSMLFFVDYEYIIHKVFGTARRKIFHTILLYWTMTVLLPLGLALTFYLSGEVQNVLERFTPLHLQTSVLLPHLLAWFLFFLAYKISPNVPISLRAALLSSLAASVVWHLVKFLFVFYVFHNKTYATLYGSLSVLVLFMLWLYLSWIVFLYGLKLCKRLDRPFP